MQPISDITFRNIAVFLFFTAFIPINYQPIAFAAYVYIPAIAQLNPIEE